MRVPPRLTAAQLFWWSVGLVVASYVLGWVFGIWGEGPVSWTPFRVVFSIVQSLAYSLGVAGVVGAFVVRALEPRGAVPPRSPRNVDREQNV